MPRLTSPRCGLDHLMLLAKSRSHRAALDQDDVGLEATLKLLEAFGTRAVPVALPEGTKDVAELAPRADGQSLFAAAPLEAVGVSQPGATAAPA